MRTILLLSLVSLTLLIGCAKTIVLHPVTDKDITMQSINGTQMICMSPDYVKEVMKARLDQ